MQTIPCSIFYQINRSWNDHAKFSVQSWHEFHVLQKVPRALENLGKNESKETSVRKESKKTSITQSNTAQLIRRNCEAVCPYPSILIQLEAHPLRVCRPWQLPFAVLPWKEAQASPFVCLFNRKGYEKSLLIVVGPTTQKYDRSFKVSKL